MEAKTDVLIVKSAKRKAPKKILLNDLGLLLKTSQTAITTLFGDTKEHQVEAKVNLMAIYEREKKQKFGFFTPYQGVGDFAKGVINPIAAPLLFGVIAGAAAIIMPIATLITLCSFTVAGGAALFQNKKVMDGAFAVAAFAGYVTCLTAVVTLAAALIAATLIPLTLGSLVSRTGATLISPFIESDTIDSKQKPVF